ncbi:hypothetical protein GCM10022223_27290 [Kineosporia mesophila]|uniref:Uncharacterized protein n=1 Tax=Kineosporia mesophila TaxID=566012 RepID=A0ABP6ZIH7_9ACTN|nr:hypothetical protein [Kineosporia mesophila]MCD5353535.1 hypothetical protein [Kineosporia mesophila]
MAAQDDEREQQMLLMFNLTVPPDRTRSGLDAVLELDELDYPVEFELKSSTGNSVSTVRDMGPEHLAKWRRLHWLFAFYEKDGRTLKHCYYASPADMLAWFAEKENYIKTDLLFAQQPEALVSSEVVVEVLGDKQSFAMEDAERIMKKQWTKFQYKQNADLPEGRYSRDRMVDLLRERCSYVIRRGATLNNPHIPGKYLSERLEPITRDHAATLRLSVREYLERRAEIIAGGQQPAEEAVDPVVAEQARRAEQTEAGEA